MFDFLAVRKSLKNFADELSAVRLDIETFVREAEDIQYAPANDIDLFRALEQWASDNQAKYQRHFRAELDKLISAPGDLAEPELVHRRLDRQGFLPDPCLSTPFSRDEQLCGLLGPKAFVELVKAQKTAMDWPSQGLPMAERGPAVARLEKKIDALRVREAELLASAEKAGLQVS